MEENLDVGPGTDQGEQQQQPLDLEFEDFHIADKSIIDVMQAHHKSSIVSKNFDNEDDNCTVIQEMLRRDTLNNDEINRGDTEMIAGNLVGYKMLQLVHKQSNQNYEELFNREQDLQKIREMAELSTHISSNTNKTNSENYKDPRPSAATNIDDEIYEIISHSKEPIKNIIEEESKDNFLQLTRNYVRNANLDCEPCEGYLEKKSPALFIKWQASIYCYY